LNRIGAIASFINTNVTGKALIHGIDVCGATKLILGAEHLDRVRKREMDFARIDPGRDVFVQVEGARPSGEVQSINAEVDATPASAANAAVVPTNRDVYGYIYTSGTTGLPKAAIIRNQRMLAASFSFGHLMHRSGPGDVIYVPLPLYHSSAMFLGWGAALATGASVALRKKFSVKEFWKDIREFEATSFVYIGELCRYLLNSEPTSGENDHNLRVAVGNGMGAEIWEPFQKRFGVPLIREFYGATEGNAPIANYAGRPKMVGRLPLGQAILRCDAATGEVIRNAAGFCDRVSPGEAGLLVGRISKLLSFDGYVDRPATEKKILTGVFKKGDRYFNTGDLLNLHEDRWISFADRVGDTFRWKGENVSTAEISGILGDGEGVLEANVYGVLVPGAEGRAGMAAIDIDDGFDLAGFARFIEAKLPGYQRPRFLRIIKAGMNITGTFKHQKVDYRKQGFDPRQIEDDLFVLDSGTYVPVDEKRYAQIESGVFQIV
ncbi:MAG: AMP-binding protein, partial [Myxococcota bacterium]